MRPPLVSECPTPERAAQARASGAQVEKAQVVDEAGKPACATLRRIADPLLGLHRRLTSAQLRAILRFRSDCARSVLGPSGTVSKYERREISVSFSPPTSLSDSKLDALRNVAMARGCFQTAVERRALEWIELTLTCDSSLDLGAAYVGGALTPRKFVNLLKKVGDKLATFYGM